METLKNLNKVLVNIYNSRVENPNDKITIPEDNTTLNMLNIRNYPVYTNQYNDSELGIGMYNPKHPENNEQKESSDNQFQDIQNLKDEVETNKEKDRSKSDRVPSINKIRDGGEINDSDSGDRNINEGDYEISRDMETEPNHPPKHDRKREIVMGNNDTQQFDNTINHDSKYNVIS